MPFVSRTRATLRNAEFGFLGVTVRTCVQTPRFCGEPLRLRAMRLVSVLKRKRSAGACVFLRTGERPFRTSWLIVGITISGGCDRIPVSPASSLLYGRQFLATRTADWLHGKPDTAVRDSRANPCRRSSSRSGQPAVAQIQRLLARL